MSTYPNFTSLDEVVSYLNAAGPDSNSNYTVYGLPISSASVQSRVDHANKYVSSLALSLLEGSGDPRLSSGELAALNLACLGVLVTVVGGSLVGAYDYFLGDMRIARSSPYASAIKAAMAGFQADAKANMANLTLGVASANAKLGRIP
jgi:hypothetical protein